MFTDVTRALKRSPGRAKASLQNDRSTRRITKVAKPVEHLELVGKVTEPAGEMEAKSSEDFCSSHLRGRGKARSARCGERREELVFVN